MNFYLIIFVLILSSATNTYSFSLGASIMIHRSQQQLVHHSQAFRLFAHHVQKKIIQKIMDRRPKKRRLSDKVRRNVNLNKCITKFDVDLPDYSVVLEEGTGECLFSSS